MLLFNESYFLFNRTLDKCLQLGNWYRESKKPNNVLKSVLSTTERGIRSSTTKQPEHWSLLLALDVLNHISSEAARSL